MERIITIIWDKWTIYAPKGNHIDGRVFGKINTDENGTIIKDELSTFQSSMQTQFGNSVMESQADLASLPSLLEAATINSA